MKCVGVKGEVCSHIPVYDVETTDDFVFIDLQYVYYDNHLK